MKTINLRWMYPYYRHDEFVDVTDEVWAAMYQAKREMENYERRKVYHRAYYSLDAYSWLENYALEHSKSPEDILLEREEMTTRLYDFGEDEDADEEPAEIEIHSENGQEDET